jgi:hypothetical protein
VSILTKIGPYQAGETDVRAETLQTAASLLVLRRDTLRIIDGAGPSLDAPPFESIGQEQASRTEGEGVSTRGNPSESTVQAQTSQTDKGDQASSARSEHATSHGPVVDQRQTAKSTKCTFSGVVPIDLKRFLASGVALVECPDCACMRTLEPRGGVLRFKSHDKRNTTTPNTEQRWAKGEPDWNVIGV